MRSFVFGLCAAVVLLAVGLYGLDTLQVSMKDKAQSDRSVVLNAPNPR